MLHSVKYDKKKEFRQWVTAKMHSKKGITGGLDENGGIILNES